MKNINILGISDSMRVKKIVVLSVLGVASFIMFTLALKANAATLTRQLQLGMRGDDVSSLQAFLAKDATIYPQGLVTGYFGTLTRTAVSNFQTRNGLPAVGRVGPQTLAVINAQINGDGSAPSLNSLNVSVSSSTATINWNTNENSSAVVYYSTLPLSMTEGSATSGVTIGGSSMIAHTDFRSTHQATLSSLAPNTTYYYVLHVKDNLGNESISWPATFQTNQ